MQKKPLVSFALALALAAPAFAQTSQPAAAAAATPAPAASSPDTSASSDQIIQLSPFDVGAEEVHGYTSAESETGTRIASKIVDLPFSVEVVTSNFMNDFAAYDLADQLAYVSGVSPSEVFGQVQLRGFTVPIIMVDGFRRIGLTATNDIDRIEVIKGSDASIYGAIQPGGAINYITMQPTATPEQSFSIGAGSDDYFRSALSSSGPVGNSTKLFYRVDLEYDFNKYAEEFASNKRSSGTFKLLYKPDENTSITLALEHDELYSHPFEQVLTVTEKQTMPWVANSITESQYFGMALDGFQNYDFAGPQSYQHNRVSSIAVTLEHTFSSFWSLRFGANDYVNPYNDQLVGSGAYYPYGTGNVYALANGLLTSSATGTTSLPFTPEVKDQPQADFEPSHGEGYQLDNLFTFATGPVQNKLLFTTDFYGVSQRTLTLIPTVTTAGGTTQATDYYAAYSPYNPSGAPYYTPATTWASFMGYGWNTTLYGADPALYNAVSTDQWTYAGDYGLFGSEHATMFDDKLNIILGGRYDYVHNEVANYNIPTVGQAPSPELAEPSSYQAFKYNTDAWTYQIGLSYQVLSNVNVFANKSSAFNPQPQIDSFTGDPLPNNKSNGYDYGFKTALDGGKLNMTLDRFDINEFNLVQTETDPVTNLKDTIIVGQQEAKGEELDFNYQASNDLNFFGDWGYTQTAISNSDTLTFLNGLPARRVPRDNVGLGFRYQFSHGMLKGLYVLGGGRYYSKSLVNLGSGKSLIPGPAGTTVGSTSSMYYVAATNTTYATGSDPKITGEQKITGTPVINAPFPGSGILPYESQPANAIINYPMSAAGQPLPLANPAVPGVYSGEPEGVFVDDGRENNFNAPYAVFQAGIGYTWNFGRFGNKIQVNVQNLTNRVYTYGSGVPGAPFQIVGTYTLAF